MKPYRIVLRVDRLPRLNTSDNVHRWVRLRERDTWRVLLRAAVGRQARPRAPLERARVQFTRHSCRQPDDDNIPGSFKAIRDLLQSPAVYSGGLGIIASDDPEHLVTEYLWERAPRGEGWVEIVVEELGPKSADLSGSSA